MSSGDHFVSTVMLIIAPGQTMLILFWSQGEVTLHITESFCTISTQSSFIEPFITVL